MSNYVSLSFYSGSGLQKLLDMMCGENSDYIDVLDSLNVNDDDMGSELVSTCLFLFFQIFLSNKWEIML